jgi:hypothetical protein
MDNKEFLNWIADRLVNVLGESEHADYIIKLRNIARNQSPIALDSSCAFEKLTDSERLQIIHNYCLSCGCNDLNCQCGDDK